MITQLVKCPHCEDAIQLLTDYGTTKAYFSELAQQASETIIAEPGVTHTCGGRLAVLTRRIAGSEIERTVIDEDLLVRCFSQSVRTAIQPSSRNSFSSRVELKRHRS